MQEQSGLWLCESFRIVGMLTEVSFDIISICFLTLRPAKCIKVHKNTTIIIIIVKKYLNLEKNLTHLK